MKLKSTKSTVSVRCHPNDLKVIDRYRARLGLRTNAETLAMIVSTHPELKGSKR